MDIFFLINQMADMKTTYSKCYSRFTVIHVIMSLSYDSQNKSGVNAMKKTVEKCREEISPGGIFSI